jgi:catechol 2,3-dioxygenase-like lactoylglutathione lyase family enzyme
VLLCSRALLRGDSRERRPALFYLPAAAVRARGLFRVVLCNRQNFRECFLAGVAEVFIVGHSDLPQSVNIYSLHSRPATEQAQHGSVPNAAVDDVCHGPRSYIIFPSLTVSPPETEFHVHCSRMAPTIKKACAITFRVLNMKASVQFYRNVLGLDLLYAGEEASFSSLRPYDSESAILNLERGNPMSRWGRLIFHVTDVDAFWTHLREKGFEPEIPRDASWGERYFHMLDPDGHELSFAQPLP